MSDDEGRTDMWVADVFGSEHSGAVVAATKINVGDLTDEHVGKYVRFRDDRLRLDIPAEILRIVQRQDESPPMVSIWLRYPPHVLELGLETREVYMDVDTWFEVQLVETIAY